MTEFFVPAGFGEAEYTEKRSRFIARVWNVQDEAAAIEHIKKTRETHWDATHNVYAYIIRDGGIMRYSDDGEPQGTSGMPTLNVFSAGNITNVCCVVTRYFGGVLLGAGGLVRAYSQAAKMALDAAGTAVVRLWKIFDMDCPYSLFERVKTELEGFDAVIEDIAYGESVVIKALVPEALAEEMTARIVDISSGCVTPQPAGETHRAVRIK
ncbi:MAG: YigZ family protein [Oscillospiraceae bacterium]|nr:YigZ family protein [Oscillospiraceae bacterium]